MLAISQLEKVYRNQTAVQVPHLSIRAGEVVGVVGNNGAGKTTLFRLILDLVKADGGNITILDKDVTRSYEWKSITAAYLDEGFLINYLTPLEYFVFVGKLHDLSKTDVLERLEIFNNFFDLGASDKYIRDLSKGNQFKVGIVACLLKRPQLLILDEPFANLDPSSQIRLISILKSLSTEYQTTIIVSSHDLNHITEVCTRILLMHEGRIARDLVAGESALAELENYFRI